MKSDTKRKSLMMSALIKRGWELSLMGEKQDELWAEYGQKFYIRLHKKSFILYKQMGDTLVVVDELKYNRRQSQQVNRLIKKHE